MEEKLVNADLLEDVNDYETDNIHKTDELNDIN